MHENRFWEIDFARGAAVLAMIVFHALFDLNYFAGYSFDLSSGFWWWFARATAAVFVLLVGVGLSLSYERSKSKGFPFVANKFFLRGVKTFILGFVITLATYMFLGGKGTIWFGALHLIGLGIVVSIAFVRNSKLSLIIGAASLALGIYLQGITVDTPYLFWLGLAQSGFYSYDYFPIFPWLGVMLIGIAAGSVLYQNGKRVFTMHSPGNFVVELLSFAGKNSLLIYFVHQPVLIALVLAAKSGFAG